VEKAIDFSIALEFTELVIAAGIFKYLLKLHRQDETV
jgi:hypothetical protein